jgi:hypothetical protein
MRGSEHQKFMSGKSRIGQKMLRQLDGAERFGTQSAAEFAQRLVVKGLCHGVSFTR